MLTEGSIELFVADDAIIVKVHLPVILPHLTMIDASVALSSDSHADLFFSALTISIDVNQIPERTCISMAIA